jgi:hypothetical protein
MRPATYDELEEVQEARRDYQGAMKEEARAAQDPFTVGPEDIDGRPESGADD